MLKIDIHTHILPKTIPQWAKKFGYGGFVELDHHGPGCARMLVDGQAFRNIQSNCWDSEARLKDCDAHDINVQVLSTVPIMFSYWAKPQDALEVSQFLNDEIAAVVADNPKRFVGLATLPMQEPELAAKELERAVKDLGLAGAEIGSHINDWNLNHPALFPVYETAEKLGACLFVHPWDMMGKERMPNYWLPWLVGMPAESSLAICSMIFGGVFEKFPALRVAFAHGGGSFAGTLGRIEHGHKVRPDLVAKDNDKGPRDYLGHFFVDSLVHDPAMMRILLDTFGAEQIALGTDYPFPLGELEPGSLIESMDLDAATKESLFSGSALKWLGLSKERFLV